MRRCSPVEWGDRPGPPITLRLPLRSTPDASREALLDGWSALSPNGQSEAIRVRPLCAHPNKWQGRSAKGIPPLSGLSRTADRGKSVRDDHDHDSDCLVMLCHGRWRERFGLVFYRPVLLFGQYPDGNRSML
jgi:hypothetical protein